MYAQERQAQAAAAFCPLAPYQGTIITGDYECQQALQAVKSSIGGLGDQERRVALALLGVHYHGPAERDFRAVSERSSGDFQALHLREGHILVDGPALIHVEENGSCGQRGQQAAVGVPDGLLIRPGGLHQGYDLIDLRRYLEGKRSGETSNCEEIFVNSRSRPPSYAPRKFYFMGNQEALSRGVDVLEFESQASGRLIRVVIPPHVPIYATHKTSLGADYEAENLRPYFSPIQPSDAGFRELQLAVERLPDLNRPNPRYLGLKEVEGLQLALNTANGLELVIFSVAGRRDAELNSLQAALAGLHPRLDLRPFASPASGMVPAIHAWAVRLRNPGHLARVLDRISQFDVEQGARNHSGSGALRELAQNDS